MKKPIIVFDFETTSVDTDTTDIIQIGAIVVDPIRLEIIEGSEFYSWSRPDLIDDPNYYLNNKSTLDFHCKNYKTTPEKLIEKLKNSPAEKLVFENFKTYLSKYHIKQSGQTIFTAPILTGYNSFGFDFPILDRLCQKYGCIGKDKKQNLYFTRDAQDILKIITLWLSPIQEVKSYSMDSIREYFGMPSGQSHDALFDVKQEAAILIKFLNLHKDLCERIVFKNCFAKT